MGHHDARIAPTRPGPLPPVDRASAEAARAILTGVLIAVAPEGNADGPVLDHAVKVCAQSPALDGLDEDDLAALARLVLRALAVRGPGAVMADVQGLLPAGLAGTAVALALRAGRVRGRMLPGAMDRIGSLAARLGVQPDRLATLVEALEILDRRH